MDQYNYQPPQYQQPRKQNTLGIVGFIFSLVALFFGWIPLFGWVAIFIGFLCSLIGMFYSPRGFAIAGFIISIVSFATYAIATLFFVGFAASLSQI